MPLPWVAPVAGLAAGLLMLGVVFVAPAEVGRWSVATWEIVPAEARGSDEKDPVRQNIDESIRFFSFGDPNKLVQTTLRLTEGADPAGPWLGSRTIHLEWNDLGSSSIRYEIRRGLEEDAYGESTAVTTVNRPEADVVVPTDGTWVLWVRPVASSAGPPVRFGPFRVDATPPEAPRMIERDDPPGYRFDLAWTAATDLSGISGYDVERRSGTAAWEVIGSTVETRWVEDQLGNGEYQYRVRARNGAGVASEPSQPEGVVVKAPMGNPGVGKFDYGVHANYTGFLYAWDLSDPTKYLATNQIPTAIAAEFLGPEPAIETENATLRAIVAREVGAERNTLEVAETLFRFLFDATDYNASKPNDPNSKLQRAGETLDKGDGICGDLAVLYVTLLRIAGVPARPVHGYLDNARSGIGGFHMWVEVYVGPVDSPRPWMTVDVSGVTGMFEEPKLFAYFGLYNPDYLALGWESDYDRFEDDQWNTWARFRYSTLEGDPKPRLKDGTVVEDYESELGRLFFNVNTRRSVYVACAQPDASKPDDPCREEDGPAGFSQYYGIKGVSKKRIDFGADMETALPRCLKVDLRYPNTDPFGALSPNQSSIYRVYETHPSDRTEVSAPDEAGWVTFQDGTVMGNSCDGL